MWLPIFDNCSRYPLCRCTFPITSISESCAAKDTAYALFVQSRGLETFGYTQFIYVPISTSVYERSHSYYRRMYDTDIGIGKIVELYADDAVLMSPREGAFRNHDGIREFYKLNAEFSAERSHHMTDYHADGDVVVREGTVDGKTTAGREYEGIGLADVLRFDDDEIASHRVYLDYNGIYSELPSDVPSFRQ